MDLCDFLDLCFIKNVLNVELPARLIRDDEHLLTVKHHIDEMGMNVSAYSINCDFLSKGHRHEDEISSFMKAIENADQLGTAIIHVSNGEMVSSVDLDKAIDTVISSLVQCCEQAERKGISIVLENRGVLALTSGQIRRIIEAINKSNIKASMAISSFEKVNESPVDAIYHLNDLVGYVQVDVIKSAGSGGVGTALNGLNALSTIYDDNPVELSSIFTALHDIHYGGYLSIVNEGGSNQVFNTRSGIDYVRGFMTK